MAVITTPQRAPTIPTDKTTLRKSISKAPRTKTPRVPLTSAELAEKAREKASADEELLREREACASRLRESWELIFEKYGKDFDGCADEIDLDTGELLVDNGYIRGMVSESEDDDEEKFRWGELLAGDLLAEGLQPKENNQKKLAKRKRGKSEETRSKKSVKLSGDGCEECRLGPIAGCLRCPPLSFSAINDYSPSKPTWSPEEQQPSFPPIPSPSPKKPAVIKARAPPPKKPASIPARPPPRSRVLAPTPSPPKKSVSELVSLPSPEKQASVPVPLQSPEKPVSVPVAVSPRELRSASVPSPPSAKKIPTQSPPPPRKQTPTLAAPPPSTKISGSVASIPTELGFLFFPSPSQRKQVSFSPPSPPREQMPASTAPSPSKQILIPVTTSPKVLRLGQPPSASPKKLLSIRAPSLSPVKPLSVRAPSPSPKKPLSVRAPSPSPKKDISSTNSSPLRKQTSVSIPSSPPVPTASLPSPVAVSITKPVLPSSPVSLPSITNLMPPPPTPSRPLATPQRLPNWATSSPANPTPSGLVNMRRKSMVVTIQDDEMDELSSPSAPSPYRSFSSALRTFTPKSKLRALIVARRLYHTPSKTSMKRSHPFSSLYDKDSDDELQSSSAPTLTRGSTPLTSETLPIAPSRMAPPSSPINRKQTPTLKASRSKKKASKESFQNRGRNSSPRASRDRQITNVEVIIPRRTAAPLSIPKRTAAPPSKTPKPANPWAVTPDDPFYNPKWDDEHPDGTPAVFPKAPPFTPFLTPSIPLASVTAHPAAQKKPAGFTTTPARQNRTSTPKSSVSTAKKAVKKQPPTPGWTATPARRGSGVLDYLEELGSAPAFSVEIPPRATPPKFGNGTTASPSLSARRSPRSRNDNPDVPEVVEAPVVKMEEGKCGDEGYTCGKQFCFDCLSD